METEEVDGPSGTPVFTLLAPHNPDDASEPPRYDCSMCEDDVWNISMHAWMSHMSRKFEVKNAPDDETKRDYGVVGHACGVNGCTYDGNHEGPHSWETIEDGTEQTSTPQQTEVVADVDTDKEPEEGEETDEVDPRD